MNYIDKIILSITIVIGLFIICNGKRSIEVDVQIGNFHIKINTTDKRK
ncbi:conserved hypothetical protein [Clostridiaceae bacterium BL-3]|nr:conserved hypothetical protein [Clostridiaceae bacterium BL-3]